MLSYDTHHSSIMPDHPQSIISTSLNFATRLRNQGKRKAPQGSFSLMKVAVAT
jgi:hypothetical protein